MQFYGFNQFINIPIFTYNKLVYQIEFRQKLSSFPEKYTYEFESYNCR